MALSVVILIWCFVVGVCIGSFLGMLSYRLPRRMVWFHLRGEGARSSCVHCGHVLTPVELVPIVSYILQKGRCRACHTKISPRYLVIEAGCGLLFVVLGWLFLTAQGLA